jgi:hypothetical protein
MSYTGKLAQAIEMEVTTFVEMHADLADVGAVLGCPRMSPLG